MGFGLVSTVRLGGLNKTIQDVDWILVLPVEFQDVSCRFIEWLRFCSEVFSWSQVETPVRRGATAFCHIEAVHDKSFTIRRVYNVIAMNGMFSNHCHGDSILLFYNELIAMAMQCNVILLNSMHRFYQETSVAQ